jgi:hypothetical protein
MKTKISKSQIEVWEWKADASKELSEIPPKEKIDFISKKVSDMKSIILESKNLKYPSNKDDISFVAEK